MKTPLALLALFVAAISPASAQIFWNNQSPAGLTDQIWCVTYGNGTFAAVTNLGKVLTSPDGITWSSQTASGGTWLVSIAYGNGKWVAVGAGGTILVSSDLKTWVNATAATPNRLNGVLYNGSFWVAVGEAATIVTSPDALNWTVQPIPAGLGVTGFLHGITWDPVNSVFLISGELMATQPIDTGGQGVMFQMSVSATSVTITPAITAPEPLEAVLYESAANPNTVTVGDDGLVVSGNYAAPGGGTAVVPNVNYRGIAYGNGYWVAAGGNDAGGNEATILTSTDGLNWTQRYTGDSPSTPNSSELLCAAYSSVLQRFVLAGVNGTILVSNAAPTVFTNVSTRGYVNSAVSGALLDGGFVISGTAPRTILIRADGPVLASFGVAGALPDPVLTVFDSNGNVVATNTGWTTNTTPASLATAALETGAFALPNPGKDSALLLTLQPGAYTAEVTSAAGNSGIALFEAYAD